MSYLPLRDYSLIGNMNTAALVGTNGSLDWMCAPYVNSPSIFAAILDDEKGGRWQIEPAVPYKSHQFYHRRSAILETVFETDTGEARVRDWMEIAKSGKPYGILYREVLCERGEVKMRTIFQPRFNFAISKTSRTKVTGKWWRFFDDDRKIGFSATVPFEKSGESDIVSTFDIRQGQRHAFRIRWDKFGLPQLTLLLADRSRRLTQAFWDRWAHRCPRSGCKFTGPWHDLVLHSSILLKMLEHPGTGAFVAAPTTSLPEAIGGERNWDYRFSWIRDSAQIIRALLLLGHREEADAYFSWVEKRFQESPLSILSTRRGSPAPPERILDHLAGYRNSRPVRIGNAAAHQIQNDIYGEIIETLALHEKTEGRLGRGHIKLIGNILDLVAVNAMLPDAGIWEVRSEPLHFVYSKLRCWQALELGIKILERSGTAVLKPVWIRLRRQLRKEILTEGIDKKSGAFKRAYGDRSADASLLLLPRIGFLPPRDRRVRATIRKIERELSPAPGFFYRYKAKDGLDGREGVFLLCSFWYIDALMAMKEKDKAEKMLKKLAAITSPTGLYPEEFDLNKDEFLGNYPQAYTHIGFLNTVLRYHGEI